jgi:hypothetical protein
LEQLQPVSRSIHTLPLPLPLPVLVHSLHHVKLLQLERGSVLIVPKLYLCARCRPRSRVSTIPPASIPVLQRGVRYAANRSDAALVGNGACLAETLSVASTYLITLIPARLLLLFTSDKVVRGISNPEPVAKKQFKEQSPEMLLAKFTGAMGRQLLMTSLCHTGWGFFILRWEHPWDFSRDPPEICTSLLAQLSAGTHTML